MPPALSIAIGIVGTAAAVLISVAYAWAQIRNGKSTADSSTIASYQSEVEALKLRVNRLEQDNKDLNAQANQLIGENKNLRETLTYQDPAFRDTIKKILEEIKEMRLAEKAQREDSRKHAELDDKRFNKIFELLGEKNKEQA